MYLSKQSFGIVTMLLITLIWTGCQKEVSNQSTDKLNQQQNFRLSGYVEDNIKRVSNVPMLMSEDFMNATNGMSAARSIKGGGGNTGDITAPTVTITSPANGSPVAGNFTVSVTATDNVAVNLVSISVDGVEKGSRTAPPYNFTLDATAMSDGTHTLSATARDAKNNAATSTITVTKNTSVVIIPPPVLPASYMLATPPVGNQGGEGSCVAFASSYARSIEQYYRTGATSFSEASNIFSPEYIYNQTKFASDCGSGTAITITLDLMKNKGALPSASMPYSDANGCSLMPTATQDQLAANYKAAAYSKIQNNDKNAIKAMIASRHPVIISVTLDNYFTNATQGFIWKTAGTGNIGHGLIICGYDDSKNAYKIMNSWGTSWGDAGYSWIDYDFFPTRAGYYVYVMNY